MSADWLVVGLGNPVPEYGGTRHNVGDAVVRTLATRHGASFSRNKRIRCHEAMVRVGDARVALVLPDSYMNRSGDPTQAAASWHDAPPERVVVVHDELDLQLGELRVKAGGSSSHNGVRDVVRALGTRDVLRLRIGIGAPRGRTSGRDHVLAGFRADEQEEVALVLEEAADALESLVTDGLEATQNRYHSRKGATS